MMSEARKTRTLNTAQRLVKQYDEHVDRGKEKRANADRAVVDAVKEGATWREIAAATGRSVSWVQAVVARTEPELIKKRAEAGTLSDPED